LLTGDFIQGISSTWGNYSGIIQGKLSNFQQYTKIYPECQFVFIGDNGQGDYIVGKEILKTCEMVLDVFIHEIKPKETTVGYTSDDSGRIHFFRTYIGAALIAFQLGYFKEDALLRIIEEAKSEFIRFEIVFLEESLNKTQRKREALKKMVNTGLVHVHENTIKQALQLKTGLNNDITAVNNLLGKNITLLYT